MLKIIVTKQFKKDYVRVKKQGKNLDLLKEVIEIIQAGQLLPEKHKDHSLIGNWTGRRDCHIQGDWLLIYKIEALEPINEEPEPYGRLILERTGSHAEIFKK